MKKFLGLLGAALAVAAGAVGGAAQPSAPLRPNIVWITVEDMSPRLGCYGDRTVPTPNIDRLAREGIRYTRAFATYGVCAPSRHTLITGMYPTSTGAMHMRTMSRTSALSKIKDPELLKIPTYEATPPPPVKCFTEYLRAAGYYCTNNAKTDYQFRSPLTAWDDSSGKAHWRNRPRPDMPFFAVFNSMRTHESQIFKQTSPQVTDPARLKLPPYYPDTSAVRRDLARHYDNIAAMDRWVGEMLKQLEEDRLLEKTVVFFFSDHGDGLPRHKRWVLDSGIQVPLIIRWPDGQKPAQAGTTQGDLVSFIDFAPSMLSLAGLEVPAHMQGQPFLGPRKSAPRKYIYACRDRMDPAPETIRAVRDQRFKYVRNYRPDLPYIGFIPYEDQQEIQREIKQLAREGKLGPDQWQFSAKRKPLEELYDTEADPHEIRNLAADPRYLEKLAELRGAHEAWTARYGDLGRLPETELIKRLWPPDGRQPTTADPVIRVAEGKATLTCQAEGASLAYRLDGKGPWHLYTKPFPVPAGTRIEAQAIRLGWKPSKIVTNR